MPKRTATLAVVVALLAGMVGAVYLAGSLLGWLVDKAERLPPHPGAAADERVLGKFSEPVGGLSARWVVRSGRIRPGQRFEVRVQCRNLAKHTLALQEFNLAPIEAEVVDSDGAAVPPTSEAPLRQRRKIGWGTLTPGSTFAVTAGGGSDAPAVAANLVIGTRRWVLAPGRYELRGVITSKHFTGPEPALMKLNAVLWSGEMPLPAVEIEVFAPGGPVTMPSPSGREE